MELEDLIALYISGQASDEQKESIEKWINKSNKNARQIEMLKKAWGVKQTKNIFVDEDEIADRVWKKSILKSSNKNRHYNFRVFSKVAAT